MEGKGAWSLGALLLPPLLIGAYMFALRPPEADSGDVINITTGWVTFPGGTVNKVADLRDLPGVPATMPGAAPNGPGPGVTWLERRMTLPPSLQGVPLTLLLADTRTSVATVYWNGQWIGKQAVDPNGIKVPPYGSHVFAIPPDLVTSSTNTLTLRIDYTLSGDAGLADDLNFIGKESVLSPYAAHYLAVETWVPAGTTLIFAAITIVIIALWIIERRIGEKAPGRRYFNTLWFLASCGAYQIMMSGTMIPQLLPNPAAAFTVHMWITAIVISSAVDFAETFWLGRRTWFGWCTHVLSALFIIVMACLLAFAPPDALLTTYLGYVVCGIAIVGYAGGLSIVMWFKNRRPFGTAVMSMFVVTAAAGVSDILREFTFHAIPLLPTSIALQALLAATVAIGGFLQMGVKNLHLSSNLSEANVRLRNALDRAEESTRIKAEFLAHISHEVRTPLNAIVNLPDAIKARFASVETGKCRACGSLFKLDEGERISPEITCPTCGVAGQMESTSTHRFQGSAAETRRDLDLLQSSSKHLLHVFNDILDISRLEANATDLRLEPTRPSEVMAEAGLVVEPMARAANVKLTFTSTPADVAPIDADKLRLVQVLVNLLSNAIKFSPHGSSVETQLRDDGDGVIFTVQDHGPGIAPEHHGLVFESFRQVDSGHTRKVGGSGLGLAITQHLVQLHGGTVWLESELGKGAMFGVRLPRSKP